MIDSILKLVEETVIDCIYERGLVEQSPEDFLAQSREQILPRFQEENIVVDSDILDRLILDTLMNELGEEYDVNLFRLKFFPTDSVQEYDV